MVSPGDRFDRYVIEGLLGQGGMGDVYLARDERLERSVALKVLRDDAATPGEREEGRARLLREARAAAALHHTNAVAIFDVGEAEGQPYIAMELVRGRSLRALMLEGKLSLAERLRVLLDVARALDAAHRAGLVHRDIKPDNVMVDEAGVVKVLDFGIARRARGPADPGATTERHVLPTITAQGVQSGTPQYMAPEQIKGDPASPSIDQFAWGIVAFELLTGELPWKGKGDGLSVVAAILTDPAPPITDRAVDLPLEVAAIVERCLSKDPSSRHRSMGEVVALLERAATGAGPASAPRRQPSRVTLGRGLSEAEVDEILQRALEQPEATTGMRYADLVEAAREVGVDERAIQRALRDIEQRRREEEEQRESHEDRWNKFFRHFGIYLVVVIALYFGVKDKLGLIVATFWGIGVGSHLVTTIFPKKKKAKKRKALVQGAPSERVEQGVASIYETARLRVPSAAERVRVAPETLPELGEAEQLEAEARRGRRG